MWWCLPDTTAYDCDKGNNPLTASIALEIFLEVQSRVCKPLMLFLLKQVRVLFSKLNTNQNSIIIISSRANSHLERKRFVTKTAIQRQVSLYTFGFVSEVGTTYPKTMNGKQSYLIKE